VAEGSSGYPPYNIEKTGDERYRITLAVAGFGTDELSIEVREGVLAVEGRKNEQPNGSTFLYRGIAARAFKRQFQLADHVQVVGSYLHNGLLVIDLVRELPETMKARRIPITAGSPTMIEGTGAAAVDVAKNAA
jgi:molecular chaperone IbpA